MLQRDHHVREREPVVVLEQPDDQLAVRSAARELAAYRVRQEPHLLFATAGLEAVPLQDARLDAWRRNFTGVRWLDDDTEWTQFGAVDDLWLGVDGRVMVAGYKATAKAEHVTAKTLHPAYRRQADVHQFLVAQQGLDVSDRAWWLDAFPAAVGIPPVTSRPGTSPAPTAFRGDPSSPRSRAARVSP